MQVIKTEDSSSFYESFSDLIFCTLVLFILLFLVMALSVDKQVAVSEEDVEDAVSLREQLIDANAELDKQEKELNSALAQLKRMQDGELEAIKSDLKKQREEVTVRQQQLEQLIGSNRFVGRSGATNVSLAVDMSKPTWKYVPYPVAFQNLYDTPMNGETRTDRVTRETLARVQFEQHSKRTRAYTATEIQQMLCRGVTNYTTKNGKAATASVILAGQFSLVASGVNNTKGTVINRGRLLEFAAVDRFQDLNAAELPQIELETPDILPTMKFQLTGKPETPLSLGGVELTAADAVDFIGAFSGRGVAVEVTPEAPDWFLEQVLKPSGYVNRAPRLRVE